MSTLRDIRLVAEREIRERFRTRALWVVTALTALLAVGAVTLPAILKPGPTHIGLVGPHATALQIPLAAASTAMNVSTTTATFSDRASAEAMLQGRRSQLDIVIEDEGPDFRVVSESTVSSTVQSVISGAVTADHLAGTLRAAGVSPQTIAGALTPPAIAYTTLQAQQPGQAGRAVAAIATAFLLMYALTGWGAAVAAGVAQEKTTRMAEILVATVPAQRLIVGKVVGVGLCGLFQVATTVAAAGVANFFTHAAEIPSTFWELVPAALLWFVLGYAGYALAFAAGGALVARLEDLQMVQTPLVIPLVVALLLSYLSTELSSAWYRVVSVLPPFSPILMPVRVAAGSATPLEFIAAVALMLAAIVAITRLALRVYTRALVRGGGRLGLIAVLAGR